MTKSTRQEAASTAARHLVPPWDAARAERSLWRVHARRARRQVVTRLAGVTVVLATVLGVFFATRAKKPGVTPLATLTVTAPVAAVPSAQSPKTTFADGSVARVSDGGELLVKSASPEHIESVLTIGAADFEVTKHPERDFVVLAGAVRVRVVGTRFRVELAADRARVMVTEGKVEVTAGSERIYLEAGESRFFPSAAPAPSNESHHGGEAGASARSRFLELARGGQFKAAYQVMTQSPAAVGSSAEELMFAADAARLSNHPEQAVVFLRRVASEYPTDSRAPLSAFTLGRVLLSQLARPSEAAEAFALARRLRPLGSLAEDALAREAEARAGAGSAELARSLAGQYLARYPQGKHRSTMQRLAIDK